MALDDYGGLNEDWSGLREPKPPPPCAHLSYDSVMRLSDGEHRRCGECGEWLGPFEISINA